MQSQFLAHCRKFLTQIAEHNAEAFYFKFVSPTMTLFCFIFKVLKITIIIVGYIEKMLDALNFYRNKIKETKILAISRTFDFVISNSTLITQFDDVQNLLYLSVLRFISHTTRCNSRICCIYHCQDSLVTLITVCRNSKIR